MPLNLGHHDLKSRVVPFFSANTGKLVSAGLTSAIIAICVAVISYTAACLAWVNHYADRPDVALVLRFENSTEYYSQDINNATWTNDVAYDIGALNLDDLYAMLAAGCLGMPMGVLILALPFWMDRHHGAHSWRFSTKSKDKVRLAGFHVHMHR